MSESCTDIDVNQNYCTLANVRSSPNSGSQTDVTLAAGLGGGIGGGVLLIVVCIMIFVFVRRRRNNGNNNGYSPINTGNHLEYDRR